MTSRAIAVIGLTMFSTRLCATDTVTYTYDDAGRLTQVTHFDGTVTQYSLDAAGNRTSVTTALDTTPPVVPTGLTGTAQTSPLQLSLNWTASSDSGSGVAGYNIYRGGTQIGSSVSPAFTDQTIACATAYSYTVTAFDNANPPNVSAQSVAWSITTPTVSPSAPTALTLVSSTSTQVAFTWTAPRDVCGSITSYTIYRGGTQLGTSSSAGYTDTTTSGTTAYSYTVTAHDALGSTSAQSSALTLTTPDTLPPIVPTGLAATAASQTQINLAWNATTDVGGSGLAGYRIYRGGTPIATTTATSYSDTGLAGYTTYSYSLAAYDNAGNVSALSTAASATTPDQTAPSVPTSLTATAASQTQINLTWGAATDTGGSGLANYVIYRGGTQVGTTSSTSYSDTGLAGYTTYSYTVAAADHAGNVSGQSTAASAMTPDQTPPSIPTGLTVVSSSASQVVLSWNAAVDSGGSGMGGYGIYRNGTLLADQAAAFGTSYTDDKVGGGATYTYAVNAYDYVGNTSASSSTVSVTTPASIPGTPGQPAPTGKVKASPWTESWAASTGPVSYYVVAVTNVSTTTNYTVTAPTTSLSLSATNGTSYSVDVKACNSSNQCSGTSPVAIVTHCLNGVCP